MFTKTNNQLSVANMGNAVKGIFPKMKHMMTKEYIEANLIPSATFGAVCGIAAYSVAGSITYKQASNLVEDLVELAIADNLGDVLQGSALATIGGFAAISFSDIGNIVAGYVKEDTNVPGKLDNASKAVFGLIIGIAAAFSVYITADAI